MDIFHHIKNNISEFLSKIDNNNLNNISDFAPFTVELPSDNKFGDITTNAAMVMCKKLNENPRNLAQKIIEYLKKDEKIIDASVAGPGFINIKLKDEIWHNIIKNILELKENYGSSNKGNNENVNIEYVSVNPTGPMHIGHARGAAYGDTLSLIYKKLGFNVVKEYYINDAGMQIETLAKSAFIRYKEASGSEIKEIPEGLYPGEYLIEIGEKLFKKFGNNLTENPEDLEKIKPFIVDEMMNLIKSDLALIGVNHDIFTSEKALKDSGKIDEAFNYLKEKGYIYYGKIEGPKSKEKKDDVQEQWLFKSTNWDDDQDRVVKKTNGDFTYFASDIAYIKDKINRGFTRLITIMGGDHVGYVKRFKAAAKAIANKDIKCDVELYQLVNFKKNGEPLKMSKRAGSYITVKDVVEIIGKDAIRIMMLSKRHDMIIDFDLEEVTRQTKDNPVFYIQYAYARICSVFRNAKEDAKLAYENFNKKNYDLSLITSFDEINLIKKLAIFPQLIEYAGLNHEPHKIVFYLIDIATIFHGLWAKGRTDPNLRFISEDSNITSAKLGLLEATKIVIKSGLDLCNVKPLENM